MEHIILDNPDIVPLDAALWQASLNLGLRFTVTGGSGYGWSRYSTLQKCPYKYYLRYVKKVPREGSAPAPLEIGACFHAFMAMYYQRIYDLTTGHEKPTQEPGTLFDLLLDYKADATRVQEAWRLFEAYANFYESNGDYIEPLAVEVHAQDKKGPSTCRYDLIAHVSDDAPIPPGIWVVEHKSASRLDRGNQEGWHLDGEIIGQISLWNSSGMKRRFGPLQGVIVNLAIKTKWPKFHREIVAPPIKHARRQTKDLKVWRGMTGVFEATNTWPRSLAACWGRYGPCEFFDHCRDGD